MILRMAEEHGEEEKTGMKVKNESWKGGAHIKMIKQKIKII